MIVVFQFWRKTRPPTMSLAGQTLAAYFSFAVLVTGCTEHKGDDAAPAAVTVESSHVEEYRRNDGSLLKKSYEFRIANHSDRIVTGLRVNAPCSCQILKEPKAVLLSGESTVATFIVKPPKIGKKSIGVRFACDQFGVVAMKECVAESDHRGPAVLDCTLPERLTRFEANANPLTFSIDVLQDVGEKFVNEIVLLDVSGRKLPFSHERTIRGSLARETEVERVLVTLSSDAMRLNVEGGTLQFSLVCRANAGDIVFTKHCVVRFQPRLRAIPDRLHEDELNDGIRLTVLDAFQPDCDRLPWRIEAVPDGVSVREETDRETSPSDRVF